MSLLNELRINYDLENIIDSKLNKIYFACLEKQQIYDLIEFLKSKHTFIKSENVYDSYGINKFELSNDDLMYMKLMDWIEN